MARVGSKAPSTQQLIDSSQRRVRDKWWGGEGVCCSVDSSWRCALRMCRSMPCHVRMVSSSFESVNGRSEEVWINDVAECMTSPLVGRLSDS